MKPLKSNVIDFRDVTIKWHNDDSKDRYMQTLFQWYRNDLDLGFKATY